MPETHQPTQHSSLYSLPPSYDMEEAYRTNLQQRTGRTLEDWIQILWESGPPTEKARREWLKAHHHLTTNYAWWVAERAEGKGTAENYDPEGLVAAMFAGSRAGLLPIYQALLTLGLGLGEDVKACPGKTIMPFYRRHVFAQIKPTTITRIDLGFALKDTAATGRLIDTGGLAKGDRITHRIPITTLEEIDDEVKRWLQAAYDLDA